MSIPVPFDLPARHLQKFWGASGDFWQSQWDKFLDITGKKKISIKKKIFNQFFLNPQQAKTPSHYGYMVQHYLQC